MTLYSERATRVATTLAQIKNNIEDLKAAYNYSELKEGFTPFQMQAQTQMIDRFHLAKSLHSSWIGSFKNYGEFVSVLQEFDTFDKKSTDLKEKACMILEVSNAIIQYNEFIASNKEFLAGHAGTLPMNKDLYLLAKDYLVKSPQIAQYEKINYRQTIIKQALLDLKQEQIAKAVNAHLIRPDEIRTMDSLVTGMTTEVTEHYKSNLEYCRVALKVDETPAEAKMRTPLVGVSYNNEDGSSRQKILENLKHFAESNPVDLSIDRTPFNGEPACKVIWGDKVLGFLSKETAKQLDISYKAMTIKPNLVKVTGGNGYAFGCEVELTIPLEKEKSDVEKTKEHVQERAAE